MRISRRPSGGRGEYEISGLLKGGVRASDLEGHLISLDLPAGIIIHTRVRVTKQGGKLRLRRVGVDIQLQKQLAATFMMPDPARQVSALGAGEPVLQEGAYAIEHIEIASVLRPAAKTAVLKVDEITVINRSLQGEVISLRQRAQLLQEVWERRSEFPDDIGSQVEQHRSMVRSGYADSATQDVVLQLQKRVAERSSDLGIAYIWRGDVLPKLGAALKYEVPKPLEVDLIDPEDLALRRRTVKDWKRWANARPGSARFRQEVRDAYRSTCLICGAHYPPTSYPTVPGVDAAHILPWSDFDFDDVVNGLCLCKLHHWAFDETLLSIRYDGKRYVSAVSEEAREEIGRLHPLFSFERLREHVSVISAERLPLDRRKWPSPVLLDKLAEIY